MVTTDWTKLPKFPPPSGAGAEETKWVVPETFFDELADVLNENPPLPGEEQFYTNAHHYLLDAAQKDPKVKAALVASATDAEKNIVTPLFQFRNYGLPLPDNGPPRRTALSSEPTTTHARLWPSRTSSSTRKTRPSTSIRISIRTALA